MTRLGFVILYTRDVASKLAFYERAFGMERKYLAEKEVYGELAGDAPLAFVQEELVHEHVKDFTPNRPDQRPAAVEIGFVFDDVAAAYRRAVDAGCAPLSPPEQKPWGQTVAYVRDDDGVLVELCTAWSV